MENEITIRVINPPPSRLLAGTPDKKYDHTSHIEVGPFRLSVSAKDLAAALADRDQPHTDLKVKIL